MMAARLMVALIVSKEEKFVFEIGPPRLASELGFM